jgi:hypothetical protein
MEPSAHVQQVRRAGQLKLSRRPGSGHAMTPKQPVSDKVT